MLALFLNATVSGGSINISIITLKQSPILSITSVDSPPKTCKRLKLLSDSFRVRLNYTFFELNSLYTALAIRVAGNSFSICYIYKICWVVKWPLFGYIRFVSFIRFAYFIVKFFSWWLFSALSYINIFRIYNTFCKKDFVIHKHLTSSLTVQVEWPCHWLATVIKSTSLI